MADLVLAKVGEKDGLPIYSPMDEEDVKTCANRDVLVVSTKGERATRTVLQNASIHKYCMLLADALNNAGMDMKATMEILSKSATIPWSPSAIKERLWRPVQKDTFDKESTTKLETNEVSTVYEALNLITSDKLGVGVQFPDRYAQMNEQLGRK